MKTKKVFALILSAIMVLCLIPSAVFAEAPAAQQFEIIGWVDVCDEGWDVVQSVKLAGEELDPFGAGAESRYVEPGGDPLSIEVTLDEGYELGYSDEGHFEGGYFFWMIGEGTTSVPAGNKIDKVVVPGEEYLDVSEYITLCFRTVSSDIPEDLSIIDSVTITAPKIKAGDGFTMVYREYVNGNSTISWEEAEPRPAVTLPQGAPYAFQKDVTIDGLEFDQVYWMIDYGDVIDYPDEDMVFEYDTD